MKEIQIQWNNYKVVCRISLSYSTIVHDPLDIFSAIYNPAKHAICDEESLILLCFSRPEVEGIDVALPLKRL